MTGNNAAKHGGSNRTSHHRGRIPRARRDEPCSNPNCLDLSCKNETFLELPHPVVAASHPWRCAVPPSRPRPRRRVEARIPNQAATPKRRPRERHAQQYGRRPLSRAAAWWCMARESRAVSVEPLEEPVRAVNGSRSPSRRERLRERVQEATGGAGRLGRR